MNPLPVTAAAMLGVVIWTAVVFGAGVLLGSRGAKVAELQSVIEQRQQLDLLGAEYERFREEARAKQSTMLASLADLSRSHPTGCQLDDERLRLWNQANAGTAQSAAGVPAPPAAARQESRRGHRESPGGDHDVPRLPVPPREARRGASS